MEVRGASLFLVLFEQADFFGASEQTAGDFDHLTRLNSMPTVLDETDSGLDVDALRIVGEGVTALRSPHRSMLVITHYQRLLDHIVPDEVHILADGKIVRSGGKELAVELEQEGYSRYTADAA